MSLRCVACDIEVEYGDDLCVKCKSFIYDDVNDVYQDEEPYLKRTEWYLELI